MTTDSAPAAGYCPHCGRGDCAPTADHYEAMRRRAEKAERELAKARLIIDKVRGLSRLTINASCRPEAVNQARDTLRIVDGPARQCRRCLCPAGNPDCQHCNNCDVPATA